MSLKVFFVQQQYALSIFECCYISQIIIIIMRNRLLRTLSAFKHRHVNTVLFPLCQWCMNNIYRCLFLFVAFLYVCMSVGVHLCYELWCCVRCCRAHAVVAFVESVIIVVERLTALCQVSVTIATLPSTYFRHWRFASCKYEQHDYSLLVSVYLYVMYYVYIFKQIIIGFY